MWFVFAKIYTRILNLFMTDSVTMLLLEFSNGNQSVVNDIFPLIYEELKNIAGSYLKNERILLPNSFWIKLSQQNRSNSPTCA